MNRLLSLCFLLLCCVQIHAERQADFFVRVLPDRETLFAGDSMLVSVVLYSVHPIAQAECSGKFKVKGDKCSVRPLQASEPFTFKVKEKPLRSTREMMRSTTVI